MNQSEVISGNPAGAHWRDYVALLKPGVVSLVVFTGLCGMAVAPGHLHPVLAFTAILCIAIGAGAAAAFNMVFEAELDARMKRTAKRPIPAGRMSRDEAMAFAVILSVGSVAIMALGVNLVAGAVLAFSIFYYAVVYTLWLKPRTPQNIVIGGGAGAFPPLIGWAAVTGDVTLMPVILFGLIFLWTPPHFWALALFVKGDYANAGIPMLPVTHGVAATRRQVLAYTPPLVLVSLLPWLLGYSGALYGVTAAVLGAVFLLLAVRVARNGATEAVAMAPEKALFKFSILYLFLIFAALVLDGWLR
ncbi:heme o synthase [Sandaracinobacteroides saxicola]|uniref:Protoheme IX farnesyltransferase n=1 Tax=Sandaracinobacteroides saxicola TaxID=2759707 RepID=A0A7G5IGZ6_9SPHN|nr:heme o synthase [Sandaracinobacteroides saxicola]QMW22638.1 protoheme IX farnesyltransferase [Sandaracinobacteroides saxicola]